MFKLKPIIASLFILCILTLPINVKAAIRDNQVVDASKKWTILFTSEVGFDDVTKNAIRVQDSKGRKVDVTMELGTNGRNVIVNAPIGGYTPGETYTLHVMNNAHSKKGKNIPRNYKVNFSIKTSETGGELKIANIDDISLKAELLEDKSLNNPIPAKMSNGTTQNVQVKWEPSSIIDTYKEGFFTYYGTVEGYDKPVKAIVSVVMSKSKEETRVDIQNKIDEIKNKYPVYKYDEYNYKLERNKLQDELLKLQGELSSIKNDSSSEAILKRYDLNRQIQEKNDEIEILEVRWQAKQKIIRYEEALKYL